ncbi:MAG: DUF4815 domain-containing protein [Candidatus Izemoplasma sp.]
MAYKDLVGTKPFYDDFNKDLNFLSCLFVPGRAVQGRELTQAQTILQNQVSQLAGHIFENNSLVYGGEIDFNNHKPAAKVELEYFNTGGTTTGVVINPESLIGNTYANTAESSQFTITHAKIVNSELFIYYSYTGVNALSNEQLNALTGTNLDLKIIDSSFNATSVQCRPGIIFKDGYFITIIEQEKVIANQSTGRISSGYRFEEDIVDENDPYYGATLRDPANGSYNANAPGASRYRITPILDGYEDDASDTNRVKIWSIEDGSIIESGRNVQIDDFFQKYREIVVIQNGNIIKDNQEPIYGDILKMIARRTSDESGDYTIDDFKLRAFFGKQLPSAPNYKISVSSGKAYVKGFEHEKLTKTILEPTKARTFNTITSGRANSKGMYYVVLDQETSAQEQLKTTGATGYPSFEEFTEVNFYNATHSIIGSGRLLTITRQSSDYRAYFGGMTSVVANIKNVAYFQEASSTMKFYLRQGTDGPDIFGSRNPLVYPIEGTIFTKNVGLLTYDSQLEIEINSNGSGEALIVRNPGEIEFYDHNNGGIIMIQDTVTGAQVDIDTLTASGGSSNTISGLANNTSYRTILKAEIVDSQQRTKSLTTVTDELHTLGSDDIITLNQEDVYDIESIKEVGAGSDYTFTAAERNNTTFDTGATDFWYDKGTISGVRRNGLKRSIGARQFKISYRYFTHSALTETSQFFTVNSYFTDFSTELGSIKSFKSSNKINYKLLDCIDFRPKLSEIVGGKANVANPFGRMSFSYETYMPRIDRVFITSEGVIDFTEGVPSAQNLPEVPPLLEESMSLGTTFVPAYTPNAVEIQIQVNDNRRYTMRDIGNLEDRIENLEVYTSLSALERSASDLNIFDSNGFDRFKNGIFVDPFNNHLIGNLLDDEYRVVTYPGGGMTCPFEAVALEFDQSVVTPTDSVANFPHLITSRIELIKPLAKNLTASTCINVNPYLYAEWEGTVEINPSLDTWTETRYDPEEVLSGFILFGVASANGGFGTNASDNARIIQELGSDWQNWGQWMGLDRNTWRSYANNRWNAQTSVGSRSGSQGDISIEAIYSGGSSGGGTAFSSVTTDRLVSNENAAFARPITIDYQIENMRPNVVLQASMGAVDLVLSNDTTDGIGNVSGTFEIDEFTIPTGVNLLEVSDANETSTAQTTFTSQGVIERRQRNTINLTWHDPLAQSFLVDSVGGAFLSSVDVYVRTKPVFGSFEDFPLEVAIVEMLNGYPTQNILRFSKVSLTSNLVNATVGSIDEDSVQQGLTNFTFSDPVYVEEGKEYAIVVSSQSPDYCVWVSVLGEQNVFNDGILVGTGGNNTATAPSHQLPDSILGSYQTPVWSPNSGQYVTREEFQQIYGNNAPENANPGTGTTGGTGAGISRQPYLGSLFLSQNSSTWTADQMKDLTFSLNQYQFKKDFDSHYIAKDNKQDQFGNHTIYGDTQTFAFGDVVDNSTFVMARHLGGLTEANISVIHSNTGLGDNGLLSAFADPAEYTLDLENNTIILTTALAVTESVVISTREVNLLRRNQNQGSTLFLNLGEFVLPGTQLQHSYDNQKNSSPSLSAGNVLANGKEISNRQNLLLDTELVIDDGINGFSTSPSADVNNLWIQNTFNTGNANISAVLEKEAYRFVLVRNLTIPLNNFDDPDNASRWDAGKYVGKTVELLEEADDLRVIVDAYLPNNSDIEVFYRAIDSETSYVTVDKDTVTRSNISEYEDLFGQKVQLFNLTGGNLVQDSVDKAYVNGVSYRTSSSQSYSALNDYSIGNKVIASDGNEYICIDDHVSGDAAPDSPSVKWQTYDARVYLTNIGDATAYSGLTDGYLIDDTQLSAPSTPCGVWSDIVDYSQDDYVIHNNTIFRKVADGGADAGTYPTIQGTAWDLIPSIRLGTPTGVLLDDASGEWKPMKYSDPSFDSTAASSNFIEFTFVPEIAPATSFEDFALKVELISSTKAHMPIIRNFRAIAVL